MLKLLNDLRCTDAHCHCCRELVYSRITESYHSFSLPRHLPGRGLTTQTTQVEVPRHPLWLPLTNRAPSTCSIIDCQNGDTIFDATYAVVCLTYLYSIHGHSEVIYLHRHSSTPLYRQELKNCSTSHCASYYIATHCVVWRTASCPTVRSSVRLSVTLMICVNVSTNFCRMW